LPPKSRCIFAKLSARVGSISDNRKGGWYGYRASKAALNMLLRTAAIEVCRQRPEAVFVALQPGTVRSRLSATFLAGAEAMEPDVSAALLLDALDAVRASGTAVFIDYQGRSIDW
jgi:NAD(P)-dependent dehydrogenase (short-subunit alcohol dehydrogenase family)